MAFESLQLELTGWSDGAYGTRVLDALDRWLVQAADTITLTVHWHGGDSVMITVQQRPRELAASKMSVGAACWDGAFVMAALLATIRAELGGRRVVEVGAGPGLPSLLATTLGARCILTDLPKVLPLLEANIAANARAGTGTASAEPLQWGAPDATAAAARLASPGVDLLLACDTCYLDPGDESGLGAPDVDAFVTVCEALAGEGTAFLLAHEPRSSAVRTQLLTRLGRSFRRVERVHAPCHGVLEGCQHIEVLCMHTGEGVSPLVSGLLSQQQP